MPDWELGPAGSEERISGCDATLQTAAEQIALGGRAAEGGLKQALVASKRKWQLRYEWIPGQTADVADGGMGRDALLALYEGMEELSFHIAEPGKAVEDVTVLIAEFDEELKWRGAHWAWSVALVVEEV